jgi:hypothetical protein
MLDWQPSSFLVDDGATRSAETPPPPTAHERLPAPSDRTARARGTELMAALAATTMTATAPSASAQGTIEGDVEVDGASLVGARIAAVRSLYGEEAVFHEDEEMLDIANGIHLSAQHAPNDEAAAALSRTLLLEEAAIWAARNGGEGLDPASERVLQTYLAAWSLAGNPPAPPAFKTRLELSAEDIAARGLEPPLKLSSQLGSSMALASEPMTEEEHIASHADESEIVVRYYDQFADYIEQQLDRLCAAKAQSLAQVAGLSALASARPAERVWSVTLHDKLKHDLLKHDGVKPLAQGFVVESKPGQYGFVGADGTFKFLQRPAGARGDDWVWEPGALTAAFGVGTSLHIAPRNCFATKESVDPSSIDTLMVKQIRQAALAEMEQWKTDHYVPSGTESVLRAIIPFYETAHKLKNDRGYTLSLGDVAGDLFDLGLTLASIGASVGVLKAASTGLRALKAAQGANAASRAFAGLRGALSSLRTGSFLRVASRELTDFVIPVFSAKDLALSAVRSTKDVARVAVRTLAERMNRAVARSDDGSALLDRVFQCLRRTNSIPDSAGAARRLIEARAAAPIPPTLYRGHTVRDVAHPLGTPWGRVDAATRDDYLAACIKHSARTGGSQGEVLSLTTDRSVAARFARERENAKVFTIDTTSAPGDFRSIESLIMEDGPRLVEEGKITAATLAAAIRQSIDQSESEVFYMLGSIPDALVTAAPARTARQIWG